MADPVEAQRLAHRLAGDLAALPRRARTVMPSLPDATPDTGAGPADAAPAPPGPDWLEDALARAAPVASGGAFVHVLAARARREVAATSGAGGPLAGWTFAVKDLIAVGGLPVGLGSAVRDGAPPEPADAPVVAGLRAAGATLVGTTALHEIALGVTGVNAAMGTPVNPLDRARVPGGSSSGAAVAVATGAADLALGTDTGGSVRIPAALCGVVGFKPTRAALSTVGVHPLSPTLDHVGLLARRVADVAHAMGVLGLAPTPPRAGLDLRTLRLGVVLAELEGADPAVAVACARALDALEAAGATLIPTDGPDAARTFAASTAIMFAEAAQVHGADLAEVPERFGADVAGRLLTGLALDAPTLVAAHVARRELRARTRQLLADERLDVLVGPTTPVRAPRRDELADPVAAAAAGARLVGATRLANLTGLPAISLPTATPGVGLQLLAQDDASCLLVASMTERTVNGDTR